MRKFKAFSGHTLFVKPSKKRPGAFRFTLINTYDVPVCLSDVVHTQGGGIDSARVLLINTVTGARNADENVADALRSITNQTWIETTK